MRLEMSMKSIVQCGRRAILSSLAPNLFINDRVSHLAYLGNNGNVTRLKRKLRLKEVSKIPGVSFSMNRADRLIKKVNRMKNTVN